MTRETGFLKVVILGGGHGISQLARYLDLFQDVDLTFLVTAFDSGGSTGKLRKEGIIGAGDYTKVCNALSRSSPRLVEARELRNNEGHSIRNLDFAEFWLFGGPEYAMSEIQRRYSLNPKRRVFLSTLDDCDLYAELQDGKTLRGEHEIDQRGVNHENDIMSIGLDRRARIYPPLIPHVLYANLIVIGPGSLYTSVLPHFLIEDFISLIQASQAKLIYVCNAVTEPGSTDGHTSDDHVAQLQRMGIIPDYVLVDNTQRYGDATREAYGLEGKELVLPNSVSRYPRPEIVLGDYTYLNGTSILHGPQITKEIFGIGKYYLSH